MFLPHAADWCALPWSPWVQLQPGALRPVPAVPGLYRIRPAGVPELSYVGHTGHVPAIPANHVARVRVSST